MSTRLSLALVFAVIALFSHAPRAQETSAADAVPDLTVTDFVIAPDWYEARIDNALFKRQLQADLDEISRNTGILITVKKALPGVNYGIVHVQSPHPLVAHADIDPGSDRPGMQALLPPKDVRAALQALPYVKTVTFNPLDSLGPAGGPTLSNDGAPVHEVLRPEVVPGELVLAFTGDVIPLLRVDADISAGVSTWTGAVDAELVVTQGAVSRFVATRHYRVRITEGRGVLQDGVSLQSAGPARATLTLDPRNEIAESDEGNNEATATTDLPPRMLRVTARAAATPPSTYPRTATVSGSFALANLSDSDVSFTASQVSFNLDGHPVEASWKPQGAEGSPGKPDETATFTVGPHRAAWFKYVLDQPVDSGTHVLNIAVEALAVSGETSFFVPTGVAPRLNLSPLAEEASVNDVVIKPEAGDRGVHEILTGITWETFARTRLLRNMRITRPKDAEAAGTADSAVRSAGSEETMPLLQPDLVIVLKMRAGNQSQALVKRAAERYARLWFVSQAWPLNASPILEGAVTESDLSEDGASTPARIGVLLTRTEQAQRALRLALPVMLNQTSDSAQAMLPRPPLPVVVAMTGLRGPVDSDAASISQFSPEIRTCVPFYAAETATAIGYLSARDRFQAVRCHVDPDNLVNEADESDNGCLVHVTNTPQGVFEASARIDMPVAAAGNPADASLVVEGVLKNQGSAPLILTFPSSLQMDFTWEDIYRWSDGKAFLQVVTTIEIPPEEAHRWRLSVPIRELWKAFATPGKAPHEGLPGLTLDVFLVGTDYGDRARVQLPPWHAQLDNNENLLPDFWEERILAEAGQHPLADLRPDGDEDGDGWSNLREFIRNTHPFDSANRPPGRLFKLQLFKGWNLISLPVAPDTTDISAVFGDAVTGSVWRWHPGTGDAPGSYKRAEMLEPHCAYWMYAERDRECEIPGAPHTPQKLRVRHGWTLSGAGGPVRLAGDSDAVVWRWSARRQRYEQVPDKVLKEGEGYWISSEQTRDYLLSE